MLLIGCAEGTVKAIDATKMCGVWKQINVRRGDQLTEPTAAAIEQSNVGREALGCKYEQPAPAGKQPATASKQAPSAGQGPNITQGPVKG